MGIVCGDFLLSINGDTVRDVLDYRFRISDESLLVEIEKANGEIWELDIEKDADEDLGLEFKHSLMSHTKHCGNHCVFCFVDQQPKGLRPSLYVKDDDPRLSFLLGNYVTLTNLGQAEMKRLAGYHLSPLCISVHTADLDLREKMMGTPKARNLFNALDIFYEAGIDMHFQVVLCKGLNDGAQLDYTIEKLLQFAPRAKSLSVVPSGLTKHREGLYPLTPWTKDDARTVIAQVEEYPPGFVYLSDEWYVLAEMPLPAYAHYGEFPQLDSGVGSMRLFEREFYKGLRQVKCPCARKDAPAGLVDRLLLRLACRKGRPGNKKNNIGIVTGVAAGQFMRGLAAQFMKRFPHVKITVYVVENVFFGPTVTVSGLLAGQDVIGQLKEKVQGLDMLFLPENAFRAGVKQKIMLDGVTKEALEKALGVAVKVGSADGVVFCKQLAGI
jgi:NifB/MoaA-like Fe-S oxidoreductase